MPVQVGGGARKVGDVTGLLEAGAARVVVSTLADRGAGRRGGIGGPVTPGGWHSASTIACSSTDTVAGECPVQMVAVRGWEHPGQVPVEAVLDRFDDVPLGAIVVTSIERDGMLSGPDMTGLAGVIARSPHPVVASGGVRSAADLPR